MTFLVTGATGNVGAAAVHELVERGAPVRAFVRDPERAGERLPQGVELTTGDFADRGSLERALDGIDRLLMSSGDGPGKVAHETAVIDAAAAAGVELIAKVSSFGAAAGSPLPGLDWNGRIEDRLRRSGIAAVMLGSAFYMTNLLAAADTVRNAGKLFAPAGAGAIALIDPRDVGAAGAAVLVGDGHAGRAYTLTGPEAITYEQIARALSEATGRTVEYVDVPPAAAREGLVQAGAPAWIIEHLEGAFEQIRRGAYAEVTDTVRVLCGRDPRMFADWAREHAAAFGAGTRAPA